MFNYKIILQYEGTRYNGWQKNKNAENTIQDLLETTISKVINEKVDVNGSGRTDAGVHAMGQTANFKASKQFSTKLLLNNINDALPSDIKILSCEEVNERFHSRLNAKSKTYKYTIDIGNKPNVFTRRFVQHYPCILDFWEMERAIKHIIGEKDFKTFCSNKRTKKSTIRTVYSIDIEKNGTEISFIYKGNGFLYNMVRIMTGTLIDVGTGKIKSNDINKIINSKDRSMAGATMPARGLMLMEVKY
jgi:tRNA pseudouridine synthase A